MPHMLQPYRAVIRGLRVKEDTTLYTAVASISNIDKYIYIYISSQSIYNWERRDFLFMYTLPMD
jgi:hypothetical protein